MTNNKKKKKKQADPALRVSGPQAAAMLELLKETLKVRSVATTTTSSGDTAPPPPRPMIAMTGFSSGTVSAVAPRKHPTPPPDPPFMAHKLDKLPGVGKARMRILKQTNLVTVGDVLRLSAADLDAKDEATRNVNIEAIREAAEAYASEVDPSFVIAPLVRVVKSSSVPAATHSEEPSLSSTMKKKNNKKQEVFSLDQYRQQFAELRKSSPSLPSPFLLGNGGSGENPPLPLPPRPTAAAANVSAKKPLKKKAAEYINDSDDDNDNDDDSDVDSDHHQQHTSNSMSRQSRRHSVSSNSAVPPQHFKPQSTTPSLHTTTRVGGKNEERHRHSHQRPLRDQHHSQMDRGGGGEEGRSEFGRLGDGGDRARGGEDYGGSDNRSKDRRHHNHRGGEGEEGGGAVDASGGIEHSWHHQHVSCFLPGYGDTMLKVQIKEVLWSRALGSLLARVRFYGNGERRTLDVSLQLLAAQCVMKLGAWSWSGSAPPVGTPSGILQLVTEETRTIEQWMMAMRAASSSH